MFEFLSSHLFRFILLPLLTVALTVFVKVSSRPDKKTHAKREDFAVGINLCVTAIFVIITKCVIVAGNMVGVVDSEKIKRYSDLLLSLSMQSSVMIIFVFVLAYVLRRNAWECDMRTPKIGWGVIFPDIIGLLFLVFSSAQPVE